MAAEVMMSMIRREGPVEVARVAKLLVDTVRAFGWDRRDVANLNLVCDLIYATEKPIGYLLAEQVWGTHEHPADMEKLDEEKKAYMGAICAEIRKAFSVAAPEVRPSVPTQ